MRRLLRRLGLDTLHLRQVQVYAVRKERSRLLDQRLLAMTQDYGYHETLLVLYPTDIS